VKRGIALGIIILFLISPVYGCAPQSQNVPNSQYPAERDTDTPNGGLLNDMNSPNTLAPSVMIDGILYISTAREIWAEVPESDYSGIISSSVQMSQWPAVDDQTNMPHLVDSPYAKYEDGYIVRWEGHGWMHFRSRVTVERELNTEMPDDFAFSASYGYLGRNNIDTYNNTFTKDLVEAGTETIDFDIPIEAMRLIFDIFVAQNISEMPDDINAQALATMGDLRCHTHPADLYILTYTYNGDTRTVVCDDEGPWDANEGPPASRDRLAAFIGFITEYVRGSDEYKGMSPVVGGYD
jgi:hypothetical protein